MVQGVGVAGVDEFYSGKIAEEIVAAARGAVFKGKYGLITKADLAGYKAVWRPPSNTTYRGLQVMGMGTPSSGGYSIAVMLNILEGSRAKS
ncbi:nucleophile aminohydrolase [Baffinella frigidus]|nr:nucleophile aminohydrolase [Cryptophyta sp. CCMP2293]